MYVYNYAQNISEHEIKFSVGLNYSTGFSDLKSLYESSGYEFSFEWPVGINFALAQEFNSGFGWKANLGPAFFIFGDTDGFVLPIDVMAAYTFLPESNSSPFINLGGSYISASGDELGSGSAGVKGAVGIAFGRKSGMEWGLEASYNSASIEYTDFGFPIEVKPYEYVFSVYFVF